MGCDKNTLNEVEKKIRVIPDFPKQGIVFRDITTLIKDAAAFQKVIDSFYNVFKDMEIDYVAAIESRGYLFGAPLAYKLGAGLVVVRKPGKLPAAVERAEYDLEYGRDALEVHQDAIAAGKKVLVIDDLLATGGTVCACCELMRRLGAEVAGAAFVIELKDLEGYKKLPAKIPVFAMLSY